MKIKFGDVMPSRLQIPTFRKGLLTKYSLKEWTNNVIRIANDVL